MGRIHTAAIGEYQEDILEFDAWLNGKTKGTQAAILLTEAIEKRKEFIMESLIYVSQKRGVSVEELQKGILSKTIQMEA